MDNALKEHVLAARTKLWLMGNLSWKLDVTQRKLYDFYKQCSKKVIVWNASRRIGKSRTLLILAIEECIKTPNCIVKYVTPTQKMAKQISKQLMRELFIDAPRDVYPDYKTNDNLFVFPNGSEIQLAGVDGGNAERIRGGAAKMCIVDEAGFCSDLGYVVRSILMPTTLTTNGKILLSSTPPISPDHEFREFMEIASKERALITKTIYDAVEDNKEDPRPGISMEDIETYKAQYPGGETNTEFQREYLCRVVTESERAIAPEFNPEVEKDIVTLWPRPSFYDSYVSMDIGFRDLTVVLFGYFDFSNNVVVIEDEIVMNGPEMTTETLAKRIIKKEAELWFDPYTNDLKPPYMRISDNNLIVINDLRNLHGILFVPTAKDDKMAAVNKLRMMIASRQLVINPKCTTLIEHLRYGIWDKSKQTFSRSAADKSHFDAIDACLYMIRNINYSKNPYPPGFNALNGPNIFIKNKNYNKSDMQKELSKLIVRPRKIGRFNK